MNVSKLLKVTEISEIKNDKNGINYKTIELSTPVKRRVKDINTGEVVIVRSKIRKGKINVFEHNYLQLSTIAKENGVEISKLKKDQIKNIDFDFGYDLKIGDSLEGDNVTRRVMPYGIVNKNTGEEVIVDFYTTPVLGDTENEGFEQAIQQRFKSSNHQLINEKLDMSQITGERIEEPKEIAKEVFQEN